MIRTLAAEITSRAFGPIASGSISIKPLTIFIGPNNSGKSFLAMLTYAVLRRPFSLRRSYISTDASGSRIYFSTGRGEYFSSRDFGKVGKAFSEFLKSKGPLDISTFPQSLLGTLTNSVNEMLQDYAKQIPIEIERSFGSKLKDIARADHRADFAVSVKHGTPAWTVDITLKAARGEGEITQAPDIKSLLTSLFERRGTRYKEALRTRSPEFSFVQLSRELLDACFAEFPDARYYLPAARSGILQSHKALASFVVRRSSLAGIEDMEIPKMSGVISDFIAQLLRMEPSSQRRRFEQIAKYLETEVLDGTIAIRGHPPAYPEISYQSGPRFPLHSTSSMVSELAPVVLFLRYLVDPREMMIIEEPESHLHPKSQRRFARAIGKLVNADVDVLLTTHSDYFLGEINNQIRAARLSPAEKKHQGFDKDESIQASKVAAYLFRPGPNHRGTTVEPVHATAEDGIPEAEFGQVAEELYAETVELKRTVATDSE